MTREYDAGAIARERPDNLETKSTVDTLIGYNPSQVPNASRSGTSLDDDERSDADVVPGTFAAGNGVQNSAKRSSGGGDGIGRDSGGKVGSTRRSSGTRAATGDSGDSGDGAGAKAPKQQGPVTST